MFIYVAQVLYSAVFVDLMGNVIFESKQQSYNALDPFFFLKKSSLFAQFLESEYCKDGQAGSKMLKMLREEEQRFANMAYRYRAMKLTKSDHRKIALQKKCYFCLKPFNSYFNNLYGKPVRDHCGLLFFLDQCAKIRFFISFFILLGHYSGRLHGLSHFNCNRDRKVRKQIFLQYASDTSCLRL